MTTHTLRHRFSVSTVFMLFIYVFHGVDWDRLSDRWHWYGPLYTTHSTELYR